MKARLSRLVFVCFVLLALSASATVLYVDLNSTSPVSPYTNWATAAANIQDAVDAAEVGDEVLVMDGVYQTGGRKTDMTNRVAVNKTITLQSVNGPAVTIIKGYQVPGTTNGAGAEAVRGIFLGGGAKLYGFTITGGGTVSGSSPGGGIYCASYDEIVTNCVIIGNMSAAQGGGVYYGTYSNCVVSQNFATADGGGSYRGHLYNCLVTTNSASYGGGASLGFLNNCVLVGNSARNRGGGTYNVSSLRNCTITFNSASGLGGGAYETPYYQNCIIYYNSAGTGGSATNVYGTILEMNNCCVIPRMVGGYGNITNAPAFQDQIGGNYRLQLGSACIDAGTNAPVYWPTDLDGNPRIIGSAVDIGAYESQYTGTVHYVSLSSTNAVAPYTSWLTAATNLQDAISVAQTGEVVVANAGIYTNSSVVVYGATTNRVALTNGITLLGVYGPASTTIDGNGRTRGVYLGSNSILNGFTIRSGVARTSGDYTNERSGGGIWSEPSGMVSNCVISFNSADPNYGHGGGMYGGSAFNCVFTTNIARYGGGASQGTLANCLVSSNGAWGDGGGCYGSTVYNSTLSYNRSVNGDGGGGAYRSTLYNCTLSSNIAAYYNGGGAAYSALYNCHVTANGAVYYGGGTYYSTNYGCVLTGNWVTYAGGGAYAGTLCNCTVVGNSSWSYGGGIVSGTLSNCIVYFNLAPGSFNWTSATFDHCCTTPLPSGPGNLTNEPAFMNLAANDLHLHFGSPCIDAGTNLSTLVTNDLDGNPRPLDGNGDGVARYDIGAFEFNLLATVDPDWLISYGLDPDDPQVFMSHPNGHPLTVLQSWIADQNPTNPESLFRILTVSNGPPVMVSFSNSASRVYSLYAKTNFFSSWRSVANQTNVPGNGEVMSLQDTNTRPFNFYRVGVSIP